MIVKSFLKLKEICFEKIKKIFLRIIWKFPMDFFVLVNKVFNSKMTRNKSEK